MHWRRWVVLLLFLGVGGLRGVVSSSPLDPAWVPGVYDDADYDDVVSTVLSLDGSRDDSPPILGRPAVLAVPVVASDLPCPPSATRRSQDSRAPPAS